LNPFSSTFRAFIQHPDELASGSVLVVPPGRKTKNHRKNTGMDPLKDLFWDCYFHTTYWHFYHFFQMMSPGSQRSSNGAFFIRRFALGKM
jgi:hypothetical protein